MMSTTKHLFKATIIGGILLLSTSASHASDSTADAIALAKLIAADAKLNAPLLENAVSEQIQAQRQLMNRLQDRNQDDATALLAKAKMAGVRDLDLYEHFINLELLENSGIDKTKIPALLEEAALSKNWHRQNLANLFMGSHFIHQRDNLKALTYAQNALEAIPVGNNSLEANDARYETYDLLHTAFTIDRNISKMLAATEQLLEHGRKSGRNIDEIPIIHNISYIFSKSRDFETASQISSLLIELQKDKPDFQRSVAQYSHGTNLLEASKYDEAIPYLEDAAKHADNARFATAAKVRLSLAYSKAGQTRNSQRLIHELETSTVERSTFNRMSYIMKLAKAENARRNGDYKTAFNHFEAWNEIQINELESLISEDRRRASEGLAVSERVAQEKQDRLQSEVIMSKQIAQRGNMIAIIAGLLTIALGFITFNLNRQRKRQVQINAELASARDRALAGEETKSKFISMMGHELRTPMNPIISLADILYTRADSPETKQMLRMISVSGRTMLSMVENILIVADETKKTLSISTQKTNIRDFVRFTSAGFQQDAEDKGIKYVSDVNENIPEHMNIDKLKLRSIFTNMLSNAVKFTAQGSIRTNILMVQDPRLGVCLLISVKDTGGGMSQDEINALRAAFKRQDPSSTTHSDGVGVGLYVTELYAKAHGGRMDISSYPQHGTRLDVYIPYNLAPQVKLAA